MTCKACEKCIAENCGSGKTDEKARTIHMLLTKYGSGHCSACLFKKMLERKFHDITDMAMGMLFYGQDYDPDKLEKALIEYTKKE